MKIGLSAVATLLLFATTAWAEDLPSTAKKATLEEFKEFADGKKVDVEIFDMGVTVSATLIWNWKKKSITGSALVNSKTKIKVKSTLSFDGEKACSEDQGKPVCHEIYIDGDKFYEVRDDGKVHAISTLVH